MAAVIPGVVDLAQIQKLTSTADVTRFLHETVQRERAIDNELDRQLSKRTDLERNFLLLNTPTAEVKREIRLIPLCTGSRRSSAGPPGPFFLAGVHGGRPGTALPNGW